MKKYKSLIIILLIIVFNSCTTEKEIISSQNILITSSEITQINNEIIVAGEIITKSQTKDILKVGVAWSTADYFNQNSNQLTNNYTDDNFSITIPLNLTYDQTIYIRSFVIADDFYNFGSLVKYDFKVKK